jgi:tRNA pseudouridine55 synthase
MVINGGLIIDKEVGLTSHDVVGRVRRLCGTKAVGHTGTLDPFATGVLLICVGRATRLTQFLIGVDKEYLATVRLGLATDTQDLTGKQTGALQSSKNVTEEEVQVTLKSFVGPQLQTPPMYSAKRVGGERLYRAAREGREVERQPSEILVHSIEAIASGGRFLQRNGDGSADLMVRLRCSSGTYVRTIAHDFGVKLGIGAHLIDLRRTAVGSFSIDRAITLESLERSRDAIEEVMIRPCDLVGHLPKLVLNDAEARFARNGRAIQRAMSVSSALRLCDEAGNLIGIGEADSARSLVRPRVVLG